MRRGRKGKRVMSLQTERGNFLLTMQTEGVPPDVSRLVMRHAATLHRLAELQCSAEAYDRDRVKCPGTYTYGKGWAHGGYTCLCRDYGAYSEPGEPCRCTRRLAIPARPTCATCKGTGQNPHGSVPRGEVRGVMVWERVRALLAPFKVTPVF